MRSFRGIAHYPEYWPIERYATDLALMKEAGLSAIRVGEFAWSSLEPREGQFTTEWLSEFLRQARDVGIGILMCTPSACPPHWLTTRYPETLLLKGDGRPFNSYCRKHYCPNNPTYRELVRRVNAALAAAVAPYDNVIAWQIDNELGPHEVYRCFCPVCAREFRRWLREKYGSLDGLNRAWRTAYWSQHITDWDEIELPVNRSEPSLGLDFARFYHDSVVEFYDRQKATLRQAGVTAPITTNFMGPVYEGLDYWRFATHVDMAAYDNYMQGMNETAIALGLDIYRNLRRDFFWLTETGPVGEQAGPDQNELRLWLYHTLARGSRGHMFFLWRTMLSGGEQTNAPMLTHTGKTTCGYEQAKRLNAELARLEKHVDAMGLPKPKVAIVLDWQAILANVCPTEFSAGGITEIQKHLMAIYAYFLRRGIAVDVVPPDRELGGYRLVVMGGLCTMLHDEALAAELGKFVAGGGVALATATAMSKDACNNYYTQPRPDGLTEVFGLSVGEIRQVPTDGSGVWDKRLELPTLSLSQFPGREFQAYSWIEELLPATATILGTYTGGAFAGGPAVTVNAMGGGQAIYAATVAQADLLEALLDQACSLATVSGRELPPNVQYVNCAPYHFFLNSSSQPRTVAGAPAGEVLVGKCSAGKVDLEPYGVCWIREK
jgi:beta-galactosidase